MKNSQDKPSKQAGFSLAEMMVVVVIIGLLAATVGKKVIDRLFTSQVGIAKGEVITIIDALKTYAIENQGRYPESLEALVTPDDSGVTYLEGDLVPTDPWGFEYGYEPPEGGNRLRVFTFGADGAPGGEGKDKDFDNIMIINKEI
jgi:general secretion pathway protein G